MVVKAALEGVGLANTFEQLTLRHVRARKLKAFVDCVLAQPLDR